MRIDVTIAIAIFVMILLLLAALAFLGYDRWQPVDDAAAGRFLIAQAIQV